MAQQKITTYFDLFTALLSGIEVEVAGHIGLVKKVERDKNGNIYASVLVEPKNCVPILSYIPCAKFIR